MPCCSRCSWAHFSTLRKSSISTARPAVSCCSSPSASTGGLSGDAGARDSGRAVLPPHWATTRERVAMIAVMASGTIAFAWIFDLLGSYGAWAEAWIFTGSILATYGMARGWTEFWLIWIGVDAVGVPLLFRAGYYPSAILYLVYAFFVLWGGFAMWLRIQRRTPQGGV